MDKSNKTMIDIFPNDVDVVVASVDSIMIIVLVGKVQVLIRVHYVFFQYWIKDLQTNCILLFFKILEILCYLNLSLMLLWIILII